MTRKSNKKTVSLRRAAADRLKSAAEEVNGAELLPKSPPKRLVNGHSAPINGKSARAAKPQGMNGKKQLNGHANGHSLPISPQNGHALSAVNGKANMNGHTLPAVNGHALQVANGQPLGRVAIKINRSVMLDQQLVERCIGGEAGAWTQMYQRFHGSLLASIRAFLGRAGQDIHLVDEISARVWYSLVRNGFELLAKFDVKRGCRLSTFLSVLAKTQARMLLRAERRRKTRECLASRHEAEEPDAGRAAALSDEEFIDTLSPAEREFYFDVLIAAGEENHRYTRQNLWQLRHRVRRKLETYLE